MFQYRQVLVRLRAGDTAREIARSGLLGRDKIHLDNLRLASIADCGAAVMQKAQRAVERSAQVLRDLGVALPIGAQVEAYTLAEDPA